MGKIVPSNLVTRKREQIYLGKNGFEMSKKNVAQSSLNFIIVKWGYSFK